MHGRVDRCSGGYARSPVHFYSYRKKKVRFLKVIKEFLLVFSLALFRNSLKCLYQKDYATIRQISKEFLYIWEHLLFSNWVMYTLTSYFNIPHTLFPPRSNISLVYGLHSKFLSDHVKDFRILFQPDIAITATITLWSFPKHTMFIENITNVFTSV